MAIFFDYIFTKYLSRYKIQLEVEIALTFIVMFSTNSYNMVRNTRCVRIGIFIFKKKCWTRSFQCRKFKSKLNVKRSGRHLEGT